MRFNTYSFGQLALVTAFGLSAAGCSDKKDGDAKTSAPTTLTLKVRSTDTTASPLTQPSARALTTVGAGNLSFTPEAYRLWISTIVLQNDEGDSNQFYQCESSEADCEVDFGDPASIAAFEAKLSSLAISPGTYTKVWLSCSPNDDGYIKFKGQVTLANGTTYYTANKADNGGSPVTSDSTKAGIVKIGGMAGGCGLTMPLAKPVVVDEAAAPAEGSAETSETVPVGTTLTMTLFSNLNNVLYYTPNGSSGAGGCSIADGASSGPGFCSAYPSVFPYFGETIPSVEYYKASHSKTSSAALAVDDANVLVKVIKDVDGVPFWASFGSFYAESTPDYGVGDTGVSGYANAVTNFSVNSDDTLTIKSMEYGFISFQRAEHSGQVKGPEVVNGAGTDNAVDYFYKVFPYTP